MELTDFIQAGLDRAKQATMRALDGLTYDEVKWQPGPGANSIGIIFFHQARSEDLFIHTRIQAKPQVWESEKWYEKLNLPLNETGSQYTVEQIAAFRVTEMKDFVGYAEAVRSRTVKYVRSAPTSEFDKVINTPRGDVTIGAYMALMLVHLAQHAGDISYIRGLQRGLDK